MGELRKDYILDRWVVIAPARGRRPHDFSITQVQTNQLCIFCPGHESETPGEIGRVSRDKHEILDTTCNNGKCDKPSNGCTKEKCDPPQIKTDDWAVRWFRNKFPALVEEGQSEIRTDNIFYTFSGAYGTHEVIVDTPVHKNQVWDLSVEELKLLLKVYNKRINEVMMEPNIKYVSVFKNHGHAGGTSIVHSHSQLIATNHIPKLVRDELEAYKKYKSCPFCEIIKSEKDSLRRCFENKYFIAFTPYASRSNYEIWILPKNHCKNLAGIDDFDSFAAILKQVLEKLEHLNCSFNYYFHYSPVDDFHMHMEITPRISINAGFELSSDEIINSVSPEDAAAFYRGEHDF